MDRTKKGLAIEKAAVKNLKTAQQEQPLPNKGLTSRGVSLLFMSNDTIKPAGLIFSWAVRPSRGS